MEVHLERKLAYRRVFSTIDTQKSCKRKEEPLLSKDDLNRVYVRQTFSAVEAMDLLLPKMRKTNMNNEFLSAMQQGK